MKPVKALLPVSRWLLRITLLASLILLHGKTILAMQYETQPFYIALAFILFGILLFIGGFTSKTSLTVVSALLMSLLLIYYLYLGFTPQVTMPRLYNLMFLSVAIYFLSSTGK